MWNRRDSPVLTVADTADRLVAVVREAVVGHRGLRHRAPASLSGRRLWHASADMLRDFLDRKGMG